MYSQLVNNFTKEQLKNHIAFCESFPNMEQSKTRTEVKGYYFERLKTFIIPSLELAITKDGIVTGIYVQTSPLDYVRRLKPSDLPRIKKFGLEYDSSCLDEEELLTSISINLCPGEPAIIGNIETEEPQIPSPIKPERPKSKKQNLPSFCFSKKKIEKKENIEMNLTSILDDIPVDPIDTQTNMEIVQDTPPPPPVVVVEKDTPTNTEITQDTPSPVVVVEKDTQTNMEITQDTPPPVVVVEKDTPTNTEITQNTPPPVVVVEKKKTKRVLNDLENKLQDITISKKKVKKMKCNQSEKKDTPPLPVVVEKDTPPLPVVVEKDTPPLPVVVEKKKTKRVLDDLENKLQDITISKKKVKKMKCNQLEEKEEEEKKKYDPLVQPRVVDGRLVFNSCFPKEIDRLSSSISSWLTKKKDSIIGRFMSKIDLDRYYSVSEIKELYDSCKEKNGGTHWTAMLYHYWGSNGYGIVLEKSVPYENQPIPFEMMKPQEFPKNCQMRIFPELKEYILRFKI